MKYYSTTGQCNPVDLRTAITDGIAPDGGLYMPASIPRLPGAFFNNMPEMSIPEIAYVVANTLFGDEIDSASLKEIVDDALNFKLPVVALTDSLFGLELFHGPTRSFKDIGTRFMSRLLNYYNELSDRDGRRTTVLVATSGNGGGAVAREFLNYADVDICVVYPSGKLSPIEEAQFTTLGDRVTAVCVDGSFEQCQSIIRQIMLDKDIAARRRIISANSFNIAQLLPQVFYYFYAYAQVAQYMHRPAPIVTGVPSGNLGNLAGGIIAKAMGLPLSRFVAASNRFILSKFISGEPNSPEINDISTSANFHRILRLYDGSIERLRCDITDFHCSDDDIASTIISLYNEVGYLAEPNAAAVIHTMRHDLRPNETGIVLLPTHPAKKAEVIDFITGQCVNIPRDLAKTLRLQSHKIHTNATADSLKKILIH